MCDGGISKKVFEGYAILALQNLGHSESDIHDFINKFDNLVERVKEDKALEIVNDFLNDSQRQIIFEGIEIPKKYNMAKINDLFAEYDLLGGEYGYIGKKICRALNFAEIIYIKDLKFKNKKELMQISSFGQKSYDFFIFALKNLK